MKAKLLSIIPVLAAAAIVAGCIVYVTRLEARARRLEARLARVEAALYEKTLADTPAVVHSANGTMSFAPKLEVLPPAPQFHSYQQQPGSLEQRVERIEKELTPHLELLGPTHPVSPDLQR
jgi:hypothetical protein